MEKVIDKSTGLPAYKHEVAGINDIVVLECMTEVDIIGVIYYEDLPRVIAVLSGILERNRDICFIK